MVGTKSSGNPQPTNNARLSLTVEFLDALMSFPNPKGIPKDFLIAKLALENPQFKEHFIMRNGKEAYEKNAKRYSRNRLEMKRDKLKREEERQKKREEEIKLKREELELKRKELEIREGNTEIRKEKIDRADLDDLEMEIRKLVNNATNPRLTMTEPQRKEALAKAKDNIEKIRPISPNKADELTEWYNEKV